MSRQFNITEVPAIVSIGAIHGGVRSFGSEMSKDIHSRIKKIAENITESAGARAEVNINLGSSAVVNDEELTSMMASTFVRVAGKEKASIVPPQTIAEDFSRFQKVIPGIYFFLGIAPEGTDLSEVPMNHSPFFDVDEKAMMVGVRSMSNLAADFLITKSGQ